MSSKSFLIRDLLGDVLVSGGRLAHHDTTRCSSPRPTTPPTTATTTTTTTTNTTAAHHRHTPDTAPLSGSPAHHSSPSSPAAHARDKQGKRASVLC
ncbi:hypothetical protein E2C01_048278 [Portunus trituberculatus]|uniref:Uncharacterized protein n=1 Tax=Portunus trituberculatus TaxID=210409 RepID=A0A5B7GA71_PORTR|nr:hypothetical protein [Portunus trituberculatus]